jgi:transcription initiation factor IIE alpha subunit
MVTPGRPADGKELEERDHYIRCPICGEMLDMRDLGDVIDHLHGQEIEEEPTRH